MTDSTQATTKQDDLKQVVPNLLNVEDATTFYDQTDLKNWNWYDDYDPEALADYLYGWSDGTKTLEALLFGFLIEEGEDPEDWHIEDPDPIQDDDPSHCP